VRYWQVKLPAEVTPPFEVYVNSVQQTEDVDYTYQDGILLFKRELTKEGKLGFWRWLIGAFGIGTYRRNDVVDVTYRRAGELHMVHALTIEPPSEQGRDEN
jgi:hypothetical protein